MMIQVEGDERRTGVRKCDKHVCKDALQNVRAEVMPLVTTSGTDPCDVASVVLTEKPACGPVT